MLRALAQSAPADRVIANLESFRAARRQQPAPQAHTHAVVLNAIQGADGTWRSLESRPLFRHQKDIGAVYHQAFAADAVRLGYAVTISPQLDLRAGRRAAGGARRLLRPLGRHRGRLEARGRSRATASAAEKAIVALDTRAPMEAVDQRALVAAWRDRAARLGFGEDVRRALVAEAEARAAGLPVPTPRERRFMADQAVDAAAEHVSECDAVFPAAVLGRAAGDAAHGRVSHIDTLAAVARAEKRGDIVARDVPGAAKGAIGFATREGVATEQRMLAGEREGRSRFAPLADRLKAARTVAAAELRSAEHGHAWTQGQRDATRGLLLLAARVTGVQGRAGTAKTTAVLATLAEAARDRGLAVRPLAPTATAAAVLGRAIGAKPMTVAKMLAGLGDDIEHGREVWMVDEASMAGARDMDALVARAADAGRGSSSSATSPSSDQSRRDAPSASSRTPAWRRSHPRGGRAHARRRRREGLRRARCRRRPSRRAARHAPRRAVLARDFAVLSREERAVTLVLDPTREGRRQLTDCIRVAPVRDGTLGEEALVATVLEARGLGMSTGKTTLVNALLRGIPPSERLLLIEDTPELVLRHANAVGMLAVRGELGEPKVTADDLLAASLRMRPDRIILGDIRGPEAFTFFEPSTPATRAR